MVRFLNYGVLAVCLAAGAVSAQQQPVFRGTGDAVRVFVTVTDRDGRLVTTLTRDDFEVRDEGKPQPITLFDNTPAADPADRHARRLGQHGRQPAAAARRRGTALRAAAPGRRRARRHVRATKSPSARRSRAIPTSCARRCPTAIAPDAPTPLWRAHRRGDRRVRRRRRRARPVVLVLSDGKDSGPIELPPALRQPGRGHRPRARATT